MSLPLLVFLIILYGLVVDSPIHLVHSGFLGLLAYYSIVHGCRAPLDHQVHGSRALAAFCRRRFSASRMGNATRPLLSLAYGRIAVVCLSLGARQPCTIWVHCLWDY